MMTRVVTVGALCLVLGGAVMQAGTIVVGEPPVTATGNCDPFGCPAFFGLGTFQEVYLNTAFPGDMTIDALAFLQTQVPGNGGSPAGGTYTLSLSYTQDAPGDLDLTNPANNIGAGSEEFFSGALPALTVSGTGKILAFSGTPFAYNPEDGNLLLTVTVANPTNKIPYLYLDQADCGPQTTCPSGTSVVTSDAYFGKSSGGNDVGGLITAFDYTVTTGVTTPEPGSSLLVLTAAGVIGLVASRRAAWAARSARS